MFTELKRVRALLWIRLRFKGMLWLVWPSFHIIITVSISATRLFCFLSIRVLAEVALLISVQKFSFTFTTWLTTWLKRPSFGPVLGFYKPSSRSLIMFSVCLKVRDMPLFLSLEHLEATVGLLVSLLSNCCVSRNREAGGEEGREEHQNAQTVSVKFTVLHGWGVWCPQTIRIVASETTDHTSL